MFTPLGSLTIYFENDMKYKLFFKGPGLKSQIFQGNLFSYIRRPLVCQPSISQYKCCGWFSLPADRHGLTLSGALLKARKGGPCRRRMT